MAGTIYATMRKYDKTLHNQSNALKARAERHAEHLAASRVRPYLLVWVVRNHEALLGFSAPHF
jgi:hypothetical protein